MNDFEMVRNGLYGGAVSDERERALAALDRIEAEAERLTVHHERLHKQRLLANETIASLEAEVERLRAGHWTDEERKLFLFEATKASYAEGTRAGCEELSIEAAKMSDELDEANAEVERLRAENLKLRARIEEAWDEHPEEKE